MISPAPLRYSGLDVSSASVPKNDYAEVMTATDLSVYSLRI